MGFRDLASLHELFQYPIQQPLPTLEGRANTLAKPMISLDLGFCAQHALFIQSKFDFNSDWKNSPHLIEKVINDVEKLIINKSDFSNLEIVDQSFYFMANEAPPTWYWPFVQRLLLRLYTSETKSISFVALIDDPLDDPFPGVIDKRIRRARLKSTIQVLCEKIPDLCIQGLSSYVGNKASYSKPNYESVKETGDASSSGKILSLTCIQNQMKAKQQASLATEKANSDYLETFSSEWYDYNQLSLKHTRYALAAAELKALRDAESLAILDGRVGSWVKEVAKEFMFNCKRNQKARFVMIELQIKNL